MARVLLDTTAGVAAASSFVNSDSHPGSTTTEFTTGASAFRMLLVDPEEGPRRSFAIVMKDRLPDVALDLVCDASAGLEQLRRQEYDLLLTDTWLHDLSWIELVRQVRFRHPRVWYAVWSACAFADTVKAVHELEPMFFLYKPFLVDKLTALMRQVIRLREEFRWVEQIEAARPNMGFSGLAAAQSWFLMQRARFSGIVWPFGLRRFCLPGRRNAPSQWECDEM